METIHQQVIALKIWLTSTIFHEINFIWPEDKNQVKQWSSLQNFKEPEKKFKLLQLHLHLHLASQTQVVHFYIVPVFSGVAIHQCNHCITWEME